MKAANTIDAFRIREKYFARRPGNQEVDYKTDVIDTYELTHGATHESADISSSFQALQFDDNTNGLNRKIEAFTIPYIPGLVIIPGYLGALEQRHLVQECLLEYTKAPNWTNLDTHYDIPTSGLFNVKDAQTLIHPLDPPNHAVHTNEHALSSHTDPASLKPATKPKTVDNLIRKSLRWTNLGHHYQWSSKTYDFSRSSQTIMPQRIQTICQDVVRKIPWSQVFSTFNVNSHIDWQSWPKVFRADAGLLNFYRYGSTLMSHQDVAESDRHMPLISISYVCFRPPSKILSECDRILLSNFVLCADSLGCDAIFLIGSESKETRPVAIRLHSGDIAIMSGPCRRSFHALPRIIEHTCPDHFRADDQDSHEWKRCSDFIRDAR